MENLYRKNKNLFERVLDKLKEFVKNLREYFANVNPNTKVEAAALKENTENGMRYLEKIVDAFDKTAEAAVENYQQGATESAAESKAQYKTRGKYWRPDLKDSEWKLLERRMGEEIGSRENYLDEATKWVYADEKGVQVFALYGIGDGTEATPLYAVGGKQATEYNVAITEFVERSEKYDRDGRSADALSELLRRKKRSRGGNISQASRKAGDAGTVLGLSGGSQRSDGRGTAGRGTEDQRGVKEKFSIRDSAGRELTEAQREYFKDSKVRDKDGNLLVMYRGGDGHDVFDKRRIRKRSDGIKGLYFAPPARKESVAGYYGHGKTSEYYLNIKNPLVVSTDTKINADDVKGYDGIIRFLADDYEGKFYNYSTDTVETEHAKKGDIVEIVAFSSEQIKNVTNKTPTADPDIRYSLREVGGKVMPVLDVQNDTRDYKVAEAYLKTLVDTEHPFTTILVDAQPVYIGKDLPGEYKGSEYTHGLNRSTRQVKMQAATNLDEMLLLAENGEWRENVKDKHKKNAKNGWYRYSTQFALPVLDIKKAVDHYTVYSGTLLIRNDADGKSYLYDILDIKKEKVISSTSFSARGRSEVFEPKPSHEQYMRNSRESQAENTGNDRQ